MEKLHSNQMGDAEMARCDLLKKDLEELLDREEVA